MATRESRYIVGIDLGTTNSAVGYLDTWADLSSPRIQTFPIPQLIDEGTLKDRPTLPSFCYLPAGHELPEGCLALPWDQDRNYAVGEFARVQGGRILGRLITSAKSWLCHAKVDRTAAILPWGGAEGAAKLSPIEVSARYLRHIREAWNWRMGADFPLENQDVVLTVPASFDEVARELTVEAANKSGLSHVILLEEPQAAFYKWLADHLTTWHRELAELPLMLVCDVGGGTTDFSLITASEEHGSLRLERVAVGDHLLLGGDNMDLALAHQVERGMAGTGKLDTQEWQLLSQRCRAAKEALFADPDRAEIEVQLPGRGSAVIGGTRQTVVTRAMVEQVVLEGFFPKTGPEASPKRDTRVGIQEWGLPYAADPAITRHLAAFLRTHTGDHESLEQEGRRTTARPDAVLFNGGVFKAQLLQHRLLEIVGSWFEDKGTEAPWRPAVLENQVPDLAVAHGATYYGLVRRAGGVRIGGGSARAYYVGVATPPEAGQDLTDPVAALCLVRHGMEEGEETTIKEPAFDVLTNQPVSFPLYASSIRHDDEPGQIIVVEKESLAQLPPIRTVLRFGKKAGSVKIPVAVAARLTEVGTLELWCVSQQTPHRWRLQFQIRGEGRQPREREGTDAAQPTHGDDGRTDERIIEDPTLERACAVIRAVFQPGAPDPKGEVPKPAGLTAVLEETLGYRKDGWPLAALRRLWDTLWECEEHRQRGAPYEGRWLNLCGLCLRPGFGHPTDDWRMQRQWKLFLQGLRFPGDVQCRVEWWILWKRVAGGLTKGQHTQLYQAIAPWVLAKYKGKRPTGRSKVGPQEISEMWQVLGSCERLPPGTKAEIGQELVSLIEKKKASRGEIWALGRVGARAPVYGPLDCVVRKDVVEGWIDRLLHLDWQKAEHLAFAVSLLACCVGDRERDVNEPLRQRVADRLTGVPAWERWRRFVLEPVHLGADDQARMLDEPLPPGLHLRQGQR